MSLPSFPLKQVGDEIIVYSYHKINYIHACKIFTDVQKTNGKLLLILIIVRV